MRLLLQSHLNKDPLLKVSENTDNLITICISMCLQMIEI